MRAVLQNWDTCVPTEVESGFSSKIGTIPPNSGRLDTLQGIFGGPGTYSPGKNRNLRFSNCWKCIEIVNPTITTLFFYHFKSFTIPSGGPFWLLRGVNNSPPPPPHTHTHPAYGPADAYRMLTSGFQLPQEPRERSIATIFFKL